MSSESRPYTVRHLGDAVALAAALGCQQGRVEGTAGDVGVAAANLVVVPTGQACTPTGKHFEHRSFSCAACHLAAGALCFDPAAAGSTASFDAVTKSCSSIACHGTAAGTFTYSSWDWGLDQAVDVTVPYGGSGGVQANWYADSVGGCTACHGYPPTYNGQPYVWHSGAHGNGIPNGNACQLCHPDATGAYVFGGPPSFVGTSGGMIASCAPGTYCSAPGTITDSSLHRNGVLNVSPRWGSACLGCH